LIVASDRVGQEFIMWYLKSAFDAYQNVQSSLQTRFSELQSAALSPLQMVRSFLQTPTSKKSGEREELLELRGRLAELEAQQKSAAEKKSPLKKAQRQRRRASVKRILP
jgi:BMFP domain-containing protein YqiC